MTEEYSILLVDDDQEFAKAMKRMFEKSGYAITLAGDGGEALEILAERDFALIISDLRMPNMDGIELCEWVRQQEWSSEVYILFLTARTEVYAVVEALSAGADDFLSKPVSKEELLSRVHLAARRLAHAATI